jgi:hypothetical protein
MGIGAKDMTDTTQPEALRLADELDAAQLIVETAKELRRLHAELQRCKQVCDATAEGWRTDAEEWKAERDALLADAARYRWLALKAYKESAYDRLGLGAYWRIGFHVDDGRLGLDATIDAARKGGK